MAIEPFQSDLQNCNEWTQKLRARIAGSDYVRVRSGGTCHRIPEKEVTLAEEKDPTAIEKLVHSIGVGEARTGDHCMCCGYPTIEFYSGGAIVAEIGLHHGVSARWKGWPGDAGLSLSSRYQLSEWLAERGEYSFQDEHLARRPKEMAAAAILEDCQAILPPMCGVRWSMGRVEPKLMDREIRDELRDPVAVAALAFRLLGCGEGSWHSMPSQGLHMVAYSLLEPLEPAVCGAALEQAASDPLGFEGAVRWLLYFGGPDSVPAEVLAEHVERAFRHALSHPRKFNRRHTLSLLGSTDDPFATELLRDVLHGLPVRPAGLLNVTEPEGFVFYRFDKESILEGATDSAVAAMLLARRGDQESYPAICTLAEEAKEPSRSILCDARSMLEGQTTNRL